MSNPVVPEAELQVGPIKRPPEIELLAAAAIAESWFLAQRDAHQLTPGGAICLRYLREALDGMGLAR